MRPWVALVDKAGPEGRHGRAARARALAAAFAELGYEPVHFQALPAGRETTGLLGSAVAATLGADRIVRAMQRRRDPPALVVVMNAQLARVARRAKALGWTVWAEVHLLERGVLARAERSLLRAADLAVCLSPLDAARVEARRVEVLPHTVEARWLEPPTPAPASRRALFVGSWAHAPNRESVRFLVDEVRPLLRGWTLVLAGNGLPADLAAPGVEVRADAADIRAEVDAAEVCVAPVWSGGGVRTKILEAMARARPVVATAVAMEGIAAEAGRHYLAAETAQEFAAAIQHHASDRSIGSAGRALVAAQHSPQALRDGLRRLLS